MLGELYGVAQRAEELSTNPALLVFAVAIGVVASLIAAWIPAGNAAKVDPVQALQKGKYQLLTAGENRTRRLLAVAFVICRLPAWASARSHSDRFSIPDTCFAVGEFSALLLAGPTRPGSARGRRPLLRG